MATRSGAPAAAKATGIASRRHRDHRDPTNFNDDTLFSDGVFLQWPEGTQF